MAPVIWGLDLKEMQWGKFKSSYMFKNRDYHLRRTKFIVYQCALIFCVVSESLGTAALSDYVDEQKKITKVTNHTVAEYNNDYVGAASYNIFAGIFVAFVFGAAFFFDLFWPARHETKSVHLAWRVCGVLAVIFHLASALTITIITATHDSFLTGAPRSEWPQIVGQYKKASDAPLDYQHNGRAVAAVVFAWLGFVSVVGSCAVLFMSIAHDEKLGPYSTHARMREEKQPGSYDLENHDPEKAIRQPAPAHQTDGAAPAAEHSQPSSAAA